MDALFIALGATIFVFRAGLCRCFSQRPRAAKMVRTAGMDDGADRVCQRGHCLHQKLTFLFLEDVSVES